MTDTPDEVVEVLTRAIEMHVDCGLMGGGGPDGVLIPSVSNAREAAGNIIQELQSAGYVVAKPFWPPGEG